MRTHNSRQPARGRHEITDSTVADLLLFGLDRVTKQSAVVRYGCAVARSVDPDMSPSRALSAALTALQSILKASSFAGVDHFKRAYRGSVKHRTVDEFRRDRAGATRMAYGFDRAEDMASRFASADRVVHAQRLLQWARSVVLERNPPGVLSDVEADVLRYHVFVDHDISTTGQKLGITARRVRDALTRGRQKLRAAAVEAKLLSLGELTVVSDPASFEQAGCFRGHRLLERLFAGDEYSIVSEAA